MRRITSAITMLALAFSLVASATPANALVAGYDSAYAGESAFLSLSPGQSGSFTVFFANTGTTSWVKGAASQVDLAACLDDKTTCNAQDATEAPFNSGWASATRYATQSQTTVAPGQIGTFTYNVMVPAGTANGTYRFNGALVLSSTGADIRNEGYYQDVTVATTGTAATLTSISPTSGTVAGGATFTLTGTGFVCNPTVPSVTFGANSATVASCGATSITGTTPAGAIGAVDVKVTNAGAAASNAVTYTYADTTAPTYDSLAASGNSATLTFSEPICQVATATFGAGDFTIVVNGNSTRTFTGESLGLCSSTTASTATSATVTFDGNPLISGDTVVLTLTAAGAAKIQDNAANKAGAQTRTTTATSDTTKPSISTAVAQSTTVVRATYTENVQCTGTIDAAQFTFTATGGTAVTGTAVACVTAGGTNPGSAALDVTFPAATFPSGTGGNLTYTQSATAANRVKDIAGNDATSPQTVAITAFSSDTGLPTLVDTRLTTNAGAAGTLDTGDVVKIAFSEAMNTDTTGDRIRVTDTDSTTPSVSDIVCQNAAGNQAGANATCVFNTASETLGGVAYAAGFVVTVTLTADPTVVVAGTLAGIQIPATITDMTGFSDAAGNNVNLAGSADRIIDQE